MPHRPQPTPGGWPTTRRHPRTLGEAFGGAEYACAIERHERRVAILGRVFSWLAVCLAAAFVVLAAMGV